MKKIVKKINGIKIDVRSEKCLYITIKDWTIYIDNSTDEKIIDVWNKKKDITVQELHWWQHFIISWLCFWELLIWLVLYQLCMYLLINDWIAFRL